MKILAIEVETPGVLPEQFEVYLRDEAAAVWRLYESGLLREIYFRDDVHTAVLMLECTDVAHAQQILAKLPLVRQGLIRFDILPLAPYTGLARLFIHKDDQVTDCTAQVRFKEL